MVQTLRQKELQETGKKNAPQVSENKIQWLIT